MVANLLASPQSWRMSRRRRPRWIRSINKTIIFLTVVPSFVLTYLGCLVLLARPQIDLLEAGLHPRNSGNEVASSDLYGVGVRAGIYNQTIGMLISAACFHVGGIKIACASTMMAFLACWTNLARNHDFSAPEAFIVISLISAVSVSGMVVSLIPDTSGILGLIALAVANIWTLVIGFLVLGNSLRSTTITLHKPPHLVFHLRPPIRLVPYLHAGFSYFHLHLPHHQRHRHRVLCHPRHRIRSAP